MNATNLETLRECEEAVLDGAGVISGMVLCGAPTQIIKITAESIAGLIAVRNALQVEINAWMTNTKGENNNENQIRNHALHTHRDHSQNQALGATQN